MSVYSATKVSRFPLHSIGIVSGFFLLLYNFLKVIHLRFFTLPFGGNESTISYTIEEGYEE